MQKTKEKEKDCALEVMHIRVRHCHTWMLFQTVVKQRTAHKRIKYSSVETRTHFNSWLKQDNRLTLHAEIFLGFKKTMQLP